MLSWAFSVTLPTFEAPSRPQIHVPDLKKALKPSSFHRHQPSVMHEQAEYYLGLFSWHSSFYCCDIIFKFL